MPPCVACSGFRRADHTSPELSWDPGVSVYWNILHFEVQISETIYFSTLIRSDSVPDPIHTPAVLEVGTYYWRVRAVTTLDMRSKWLPVWSFTVNAHP